MPNHQFFSYIMARTSQFSMRWWWCPRCSRPTRWVRFWLCQLIETTVDG